MQVRFVEQFYYPEGWGGAQLPRDITTHLARSGFDVEVICGGDQYAEVSDDATADPRDDGVVIKRIWRLFGGGVHRLKLIRQLWFCFAAFPLLLLRRSPRLFVAQTNPPLIVPLVAVAALIRRRPFVVIAQDIYPEVVFAHGMMKSDGIAAKLLSKLFRWAYGRAERVVSLGPTMSERLVEKGVRSERIVYISNWSTGDQQIVRDDRNKLRKEWDLENKFVIVYSGNLGISHDIETPILALRDVLPEFEDTRLVFIGKGSRLAEAKELVASVGVGHAVQFRPFVSSDLLPHSLGLADVALVTLKDGFQGLVVPSKLLGYLARGIPTLYVGPDSDVQQILASSRAGDCVQAKDAESLAVTIKRLASDRNALDAMSSAGERYYEEKLARPIGLDRYYKMLSELAREPALSSQSDR